MSGTKPQQSTMSVKQVLSEALGNVQGANQPRGLNNFIQEIRRCSNAAQEQVGCGWKSAKIANCHQMLLDYNNIVGACTTCCVIRHHGDTASDSSNRRGAALCCSHCVRGVVRVHTGTLRGQETAQQVRSQKNVLNNILAL